MGYQKIDQSWVSVTSSIVQRVEFLTLGGWGVEPLRDELISSSINIPNGLLGQRLISIQFQSYILFEPKQRSLLLANELDSKLQQRH